MSMYYVVMYTVTDGDGCDFHPISFHLTHLVKIYDLFLFFSNSFLNKYKMSLLGSFLLDEFCRSFRTI